MVTVFGVDHSPWTQAVVLAHANNGVAVRLRPYPSWKYFLQCGVVMPAQWQSDGTLTTDSLSILQKLLPAHTPEDHLRQEADFKALETLFLAYALERSGPGRRWAFWRGWAGMTDRPRSLFGSACRALLCWYFFLLISVGRVVLGRRLALRSPEDRLNYRLSRWITRLEESPYLGGGEPDASDFGLLGHIECMSSGLTDWALDVVEKHPVLLDWLRRMHSRLDTHSVVYSRRLLSKEGRPKAPSFGARAWFYLWMVLWAVAIPISVPILAYAFLRRRKVPHRSGGRLEAR